MIYQEGTNSCRIHAPSVYFGSFDNYIRTLYALSYQIFPPTCSFISTFLKQILDAIMALRKGEIVKISQIPFEILGDNGYDRSRIRLLHHTVRVQRLRRYREAIVSPTRLEVILWTIGILHRHLSCGRRGERGT
jgi:hypothetical protein